MGVSILAIHHNLFLGSQLDVNAKTYEVIKFLGKGKGGYSYLATDGDQGLLARSLFATSKRNVQGVISGGYQY